MAEPAQAQAETTTAATAEEVGSNEAGIEASATQAADAEGATGETQSASGTETSTTEGSATASTTGGTSAGVGVEGYEKMLADAKAEAESKGREERETKWQQAKAAAKADDANADTDLSGTQESRNAETVTGEAETATAADEGAAAVSAASTDGAEEAAGEQDDQLANKRIRLKGLPDGHLVAAANEIARAEGISFTDAFARVTSKAAAATTTGSQSATETATGTTQEQTATRSIDQIQQDIETRKAEKRTAAKDLDAEKIVDCDEALDTLREELAQTRAAEAEASRRKEQSAQQEFERAANTSKANAVKNWPEAADAKSDFSKRMVELADAYEADPSLRHHVYEADAPFYFAELVAKEMKLLPAHMRKAPAETAATTKTSTPAAAKPAQAAKPQAVRQSAVVARPHQSAGSPVSGAARTTQGGTSAQDTLGLDKVRSPHDYEQALKKVKSLQPA